MPDSRLQRVKQFLSDQKWLWAVALTVLPLFVGGSITWYAGAQQAQKNFTQSQQKEAYSAFDSAIDEFRETVWAEVRLGGPYPDDPPFPPTKENLGASVNKLLFAESKITFYGSEEAHKAAGEVMTQIWAVRAPLLAFISQHQNYPQLNADQFGEFEKAINEISSLIGHNLKDAQTNFRDTARKDLGLPLLPRDSIDTIYAPPATARAIPGTPTVSQGPSGH